MIKTLGKSTKNIKALGEDIVKVVAYGEEVWSRETILDYFCSTALDEGFIYFSIPDDVNTTDFLYIEWSRDGINWEHIENTNDNDVFVEIEVSKGEKIYWKGEGKRLSSLTQTGGIEHRVNCNFYSDCPCELSGRIMSLLKGDNYTSMEGVYDHTFENLFSTFNDMLVNVEDLKMPTTLYGEEPLAYAFYHTFDGCTEIEVSPNLSAPTLYESCYEGMFYGCSKLERVKCLAIDISATDCTKNWLYDVKSSGAFTQSSGITWTSSSASGIPSNWENYDEMGSLSVTIKGLVEGQDTDNISGTITDSLNNSISFFNGNLNASLNYGEQYTINISSLEEYNHYSGEPILYNPLFTFLLDKSGKGYIYDDSQNTLFINGVLSSALTMNLYNKDVKQSLPSTLKVKADIYVGNNVVLLDLIVTNNSLMHFKDYLDLISFAVQTTVNTLGFKIKELLDEDDNTITDYESIDDVQYITLNQDYSISLSGGNFTKSTTSYNNGGTIIYVNFSLAQVLSDDPGQSETPVEPGLPEVKVTIQPLIPYDWHLSEPFNGEMPQRVEDDGTLSTKRCGTGCGALAAGMIMAYYGNVFGADYRKGVVNTTNLKPLDAYTYGNGKYTATALDPVPLPPNEGCFDYSAFNIRNASGFTTQHSKDEVARFLKYIAHSVRTSFRRSTGSATANPSNIKAALTKYFKLFDVNSLVIVQADKNNMQEFKDIVYNELKLGYPVYIGAAGVVINSKKVKSSFGHSFICDGYDAATDKFHFNMGWPDSKWNNWYDLGNLKMTRYGTTYDFTNGKIGGNFDISCYACHVPLKNPS